MADSIKTFGYSIEVKGREIFISQADYSGNDDSIVIISRDEVDQFKQNLDAAIGLADSSQGE